MSESVKPMSAAAAAAKIKSMEELYTAQVATLTAERDELFHRLQELEENAKKERPTSPTPTPPPPSTSPRPQLKKEPGVSLKPLTKGGDMTASATLSASISSSTNITNNNGNSSGVVAAMRVRIANLEQIVKEKEDSKNNEIKALKAALADSEKILGESRKEAAALTATLEKERASSELAAISSAKQITDLKAELERARHRYRMLEAEKRAAAIEKSIECGCSGNAAASPTSQDTLQGLLQLTLSDSSASSDNSDNGSVNESLQIINKLKRALLNSRKEACYLYAKVAALHQQALANSALGGDDIGDDDAAVSSSSSTTPSNDSEEDAAAAAVVVVVANGTATAPPTSPLLMGSGDIVSQTEYLYLKRTVEILREEINSMCEVLNRERNVIADILSYNKFDEEGAHPASAAEDETRGSGREPFNILGKFIKTFSTVVGKFIKKFKEQHDLLVKILDEEPISSTMNREIKAIITPTAPDAEDSISAAGSAGAGETLITPGAIRSSLISVTSYAQSAAASEEEALRKK